MEAAIDLELVALAQAGDETALNLLFQDYLPLIYDIVDRALNGGPDVDDVVQETLVRAIQGLPSLREPERFRSWLSTIALRQLRDCGQLRTRRAERESSLEQLEERPDPVLDFVDETILELGLAGQRHEIVEATRWLPAQDRQLLALWWQEAAGVITRSELAAAAGLSPEHAAVRVQRLKARLWMVRIIQRTALAEPRHLQGALKTWGGQPDPALLGRLARHVRRCARCQTVGESLVPPENLLLGIARLPVPLSVPLGFPALLAGAVADDGHLSGLAAAGAKAVAAKQSQVKPALTIKAAVTTGTALASAAIAVGFAVQYLPSNPVPASPRITTSAPAALGRTPTWPVSSGLAAAASAATAVARGPGVRSADWYVAPGGSDAADGSSGRPFATVAKALSLVRPGQTIALRGGRFRVADPALIDTFGTATHRITLSSYADQRPVLDAAGLSAGSAFITQRAGYWRTVQGTRDHPLADPTVPQPGLPP